MVLRNGLDRPRPEAYSNLTTLQADLKSDSCEKFLGIQAMLPYGRFVSLEVLKVLVSPIRDLRLQRFQPKGL